MELFEYPSDERIQILQDINQGKKINQVTNVLENIFEANYCCLLTVVLFSLEIEFEPSFLLVHSSILL